MASCEIMKFQNLLLHILIFPCSSFSGKEDGHTEKEKQIDQIYFEYSKRLSLISQVRHKSMDIKDEVLAAHFEKFHSEMHQVCYTYLKDELLSPGCTEIYVVSSRDFAFFYQPKAES